MNFDLGNFSIDFQAITLIVLVIIKVFKNEKVQSEKAYRDAWIMVILTIAISIFLFLIMSFVFKNQEYGATEYFIVIFAIIQLIPNILMINSWLLIYEVITGDKLIRIAKRI